jgi:hypothetical protein
MVSRIGWDINRSSGPDLAPTMMLRKVQRAVYEPEWLFIKSSTRTDGMTLASYMAIHEYNPECHDQAARHPGRSSRVDIHTNKLAWWLVEGAKASRMH